MVRESPLLPPEFRRSPLVGARFQPEAAEASSPLSLGQSLLDELQKAILDAKEGKSPENALTEASKKWSEQMDERGSDSFIHEWENSLGL